jgi:hypothetical protein
MAVECDEQLRDEWKESPHYQTKFQGDWCKFVCVDKTSKNEKGYAWWSLSGQPAGLSNVLVWGDRYFLVAAITTEGYIATHVVVSCLDPFDFYNFIAENMVSFAHSLYTWI